MPKNGYKSMVQDYYVGRVRQMDRLRDQELASIRTAQEAQRYQEKVRKVIDRAFGPRCRCRRCPRKTALNPEITGVVERDTHRIEKILFESRPGCLVSANLYIPGDLSGPAPGVVAPCGHMDTGKAGGLYQGFCQRLVRSGFVVIIYDPINQGERDQYHHLKNREIVRGCCNAHNMMGKQLELVGEFFGMWRAWDGIRTLDYLLTRPEVDQTRIGVTGNSGGGTLTEWLWALDDRFTMAAPGCFLTTYLSNLENELPQDCEQYPPGIIGGGLEMIDLMIARAPKPAILLGQAYDYFDARGLHRAYEDLQQFYRILGRPQNVDLFIGPHGHGYFKENQEAMVRFFTRHAGMPTPVTLEETEELDEEVLFATTEGNTIAAGARPVYELIADRADQRISRRTPTTLPLLRRRLRRILALPPAKGVPRYRVLRASGPKERRFARYVIETEANIKAILRKRITEDHMSSVLEAEKEVTLYIPHVSVQADVECMELDQVNPPFFALDPRGMGESMPDADMDAFFHPYGLDYMYHGFGLLLGESYLGRRVHDILRTMDLLGDRGASSISLHGRGQGAILALFAALLHPLADHLTLENGPTSFDEWAHSPLVLWPAANFPRGILGIHDIPDLIEILGDRVTVVEPWGPDMKPVASQ